MYLSTQSTASPAVPRFAFRQAYEGVDGSIAQARNDFREAVGALRLSDDVVDDASLCLSELTTNSIRHVVVTAFRGFLVEAQLRARQKPVLRLEVHDFALGALPDLTPPDPMSIPYESTGGRGLALVAALSSATGVDRTAAGKRVWCELPAQIDEGLAFGL